MSEIKINESEWNSVTPEQQEQITSILKKTGLLKDGDQIVADSLEAKESPINTDGIFCEIACGVAEAAAVAACAAFSGPAAAVCIAAAHAGGNLCRSRC